MRWRLDGAAFNRKVNYTKVSLDGFTCWSIYLGTYLFNYCGVYFFHGLWEGHRCYQSDLWALGGATARTSLRCWGLCIWSSTRPSPRTCPWCPTLCGLVADILTNARQTHTHTQRQTEREREDEERERLKRERAKGRVRQKTWKKRKSMPEIQMQKRSNAELFQLVCPQRSDLSFFFFFAFV